MPSCSPFLPAGSYQASCTDLVVTLSANYLNTDGASVPSTLTFNPFEVEGIEDLANINSVLTLVPGSGTPEKGSTPFLPAGSYQSCSRDISLTLQANCQHVNGDDVLSRVSHPCVLN